MVESFVRPEWSPGPREDCVNVDGRVLGKSGPVFLALLRFQERGTIDEHSASFDVEVFCLEGEGFASIGGEAQSIAAGERLRWPAATMHRLWTEDSTMITLMVEHHGTG